MDIDYQTEVKDSHVQLSCRGTYSNEVMYSVYESALEIATRENLKAVLIDIRAMDGKTPTTMECYEHGVTVSKIQLRHSTRVLIVVVGKEPIMDAQRHCETVATNRGGFGKAFTDIDAATTWLEETINSAKLN